VQVCEYEIGRIVASLYKRLIRILFVRVLFASAVSEEIRKSTHIILNQGNPKLLS
jgi:hypothetical protein